MNAHTLCRRSLAVGFAVLLLAGCGGQGKSDAQAPAPVTNAAPAAAEGDESAAAPTAVIAAARTQIKSGDVDQAAAKLVQLQTSGASFTAQQAKDYREAMSEAYDRAYEAAQRGDARAQAALQVLRAARR